MSCKGIDLKAGVTDSSEFHAQTKQSMLRCAKKKILILDSSKIDKVSFIDIAPLDAFDIVVTNTAPQQTLARLLRRPQRRMPLPRKIKQPPPAAAKAAGGSSCLLL